MSAVAEPKTEKNYLNVDYSIKSWLTTLDHKRIGILYLVAITIFFMVGGFMALLIRTELATPQGDLLSSDQYNRAFTMHGVVLIFFFLLPSTPAVLGNFLLPIMIGARDVAFPKLNLASWYAFMIGGTLGVISLVLGGIDTGWTFYAPYSSNFSNTPVVWAIAGAFVAGFGNIATAVNFIVTIHKMRAPGLTWFRLPLFVWAQYATAVIGVLGTPVIAITIFLVAFERLTGMGIFDPARGGDPILMQHLFWFYSHPAVYIMILPAMGVTSEMIAAASQKRVFGYEFVAFSSLAIAIIGFLVWGHHLFVSGQSVFAGLVFSVLTFIVAIPSAIKTFNWVATMYKGNLQMNTPMFWAVAFLGLFLIGGLTGLFLSSLATDIHLHDTYFVVAHFHYIMVGGAIIGFIGGLHFWWPKITGRMYPESWGKAGAIMVFTGFSLTFLPQFVLGQLGMPRRYHTYPEEFQILHVLSTGGAYLLGFAMTTIIVYLAWSAKYGKPAPPNPWKAKGLEWETPSPPPTENFTYKVVVTEPAYNYHKDSGGHH
ncbi:MAG: Cytochrome c oxidase polypeptide I+III [Fimbriimonadales bacterium]|nr:MAG: cytochrome c oxidase subunit I [Armatimonadota bacterium]MBV6503597.1 Cytochrome c oxidase polypeptide I+III [Fimbriimonadales bacterium]MCE7900685.1 cytochrome c oxidase subunit I [Armatimonadetes bacterium ATM1]MDL1928565.1 cytochrome c oxidase subunit I [Fimbriimonadia bacterium ATM]MBC6970047.1 cytochrome c oxidase subunit I [Armatimonadota bacterium]